MMASMRQFDTGATRDQDTTKLDFEGFLSPVVMEMFGEYMNKNRVQADGTTRASDNWQLGIPLDAYMKSMFRHFFSVWKHHRGLANSESLEDALMGLMFNVQGYAHETEKEKQRSMDVFSQEQTTFVKEVLEQKKRLPEGSPVSGMGFGA